MSKSQKVAEFNLWADSFHEGEWACRNIAREIESQGGSFTYESKLEAFHKPSSHN